MSNTLIKWTFRNIAQEFLRFLEPFDEQKRRKNFIDYRKKNKEKENIKSLYDNNIVYCVPIVITQYKYKQK